MGLLTDGGEKIIVRLWRKTRVEEDTRMATNKVRKFLGAGALLLAAVLWGTAFVTQLTGMDHLSPLAFNALRFTLGSLSVAPLLALPEARALPGNWKRTILACVLSGTALFAAIAFEQYGVALSGSAGRSGFITALYIVITPLLGMAMGEKSRPQFWIALPFSLVGLGLLTLTGKQGGIGLGDVLLLIGAFFFAAQLHIVNRMSVNTLHLSFGQLVVAAILSWILTLVTGQAPTWGDIGAAAWPVIYSGVIATGVAYTLQVFGQTSVDPSSTSILMSMESLFSVIGGAVFLGERMSVQAYIGCVLMLAGTVISELPSRRKSTDKPLVTERKMD
jgi:drug/metabolite transporter (DMT)-like permease